MLKRFILPAAFVSGVAMALALGSCGEDSDESGSTATGATGTEAEQTPAPTGKPTATVKATLGEYFIRTEPGSVEAGTIRFEVTNEGELEHEFEVVKTDEPPGDIPLTDDDKADVDAVGEALGEIEPFAGGETEELTLELEPGKIALICNIPGHYGKGQYAGFTVR